MATATATFTAFAANGPTAYATAKFTANPAIADMATATATFTAFAANGPTAYATAKFTANPASTVAYYGIGDVLVPCRVYVGVSGVLKEVIPSPALRSLAGFGTAPFGTSPLGG
jgi:hypothetical protein